jgi:hypothetical protein
MRQLLASLMAMSILTGTSAAALGEEVAAWTISLRPTDFVIGAALAQLYTRRAVRTLESCPNRRLQLAKAITGTSEITP